MENSEYTLLDEKDIHRTENGCIFCGYLNKNIRQVGIDKEKTHLSRCHKQQNRIYSSNGVHPTISSTESAGRYYIKDERTGTIRKLTLTECCRLMGLNEDETKQITECGLSNTNVYKLLGNSIVIPVLYHIFRTMFIQEDKPILQQTKLF